LVFAEVLSEIAQQNDIALQTQLHIKKANLASVRHIRDKLTARLLKNWQMASASCVVGDMFCQKINTSQEMIAAGKELADNLPKPYRSWYLNARLFHKNYANELIRLAALFPAVSSEIDIFSTLEHDGFELPDRQFLLTFDDGPTNQKGNTDALLPLLSKGNIHASFYMLGERLQARLKQNNPETLAKNFQGQCAALHGWEHQSHAKWTKWQSSVTDTRDLVKATLPGQYRPWFRPPYGQRKPDSGGFFKKNGLQVALWNIDSQDWNSHVTGKDAAQRVFTLMLLWRHGVILFHDVHPKALVAVPWLLEHVLDTGISWKDCQTY
jgi:peptidoglycan/xylan/chitin deacetylase (PgdA/CDA1 family)